jgi:hypothetical protein
VRPNDSSLRWASLPLLFLVSISLGLMGCGDGETRQECPEILSFWADPGVLHPGGTTQLSWRIEKALDADIYPMIGPVGPVEGTIETPPTDDAILYTLTATNKEGSATAQVYVPIEPEP